MTSRRCQVPTIENVDDVIRDKDTSYNYATAVGEDMFRFNTIPFNPTEIYGVYAEALVRREGLLAHTGRIKATRGGMTLTGPTVALTRRIGPSAWN